MEININFNAIKELNNISDIIKLEDQLKNETTRNKKTTTR